MNITFLDLKANYNSIKSEVNAAIQNVLDNTAYILGKSVSDFETEFAKEFAKAHNVQFCYGVSSGTDANHLALCDLPPVYEPMRSLVFSFRHWQAEVDKMFLVPVVFSLASCVV